MRDAGFQVFAIDHSHNRFTAKVPIFTVDLSKPDEVAVAVNLLHLVKPTAVHFGLMCGTCSRARERAIPRHLRKQGAPEPKQLRDESHLLGRPFLSPWDEEKVQAANTIYRHAITLLKECFALSCIISIENPTRSWLWPLLAQLVKETADTNLIQQYFALEATCFDSCMHGGQRAKSTTFLGTPKVFSRLASKCDQSHDHLPWGLNKTNDTWTFDTAAEAAYPALLCQRLASCILDFCEPNTLHLRYNQLRLTSLQAQGRQHRQLAQLVPDFRAVEWRPRSAPLGPLDKPLLPKTAGEINEARDESNSGNLVKVGIFHSHQEHISVASTLQHPMDSQSRLPDILRKVVFELLTTEPAEMAKKRLAMLQTYVQRAKDLQEQENQLHETLPKHIQSVVKGKRILLFEERLAANSFPDMTVLESFKQGVDLVGEEPSSPLFLEKPQPASMTVQQLESSARFQRQLAMQRPMAQHELEHADRLVELSQEEVTEGFLEGPFSSEEQVSQAIGSQDWTLTKRFLLIQGEEGKERIIDDYRRSLVNCAFASRSYLALEDVDIITAVLHLVMKLLCSGPLIALELSDGTVLRGCLSAAARNRERILGRCFDLSKAYKQVAVSSSSLKYAVLGARDSSGKWNFYTSQSLPFGSTSSVYGFNKLAKAFQFLLLRDFGVLALNFYDDYPTVDFSSAAQHTTNIVSQFLRVLGWRHAVEGKKAIPFAETFTALGVNFSLGKIYEGSLTVGNKPERLARIARMVGGILNEGKLHSHLAASIHGLLNFATGFTLGKALQPAAACFSQATSSPPKPEELNLMCRHTLEVLEAIQPRAISVASIETPILVYTDGAFESGSGTWGAIILDSVTGLRLCFEGAVPSFLLKAWSDQVGEQLICQIEMFAYLCVRWHLRDVLHGRRVIAFIDNEPCRFALIKGRSASQPLFRMVHACSCIEAVMPCYPWIERVASKSNPSDLPSRGESLAACSSFLLKFVGDICLPPELYATIVDGAPFPKLRRDQQGLEWIISETGVNSR